MDNNRSVLSICVAAAMLAGCGGSQPPIGAPGAMPRASAVTAVRAIHHATPASSYYQTLHSFGWDSDGYWPVASLINVNGTFYGTTAAGGGTEFGGGTVFAITPTGTENVLHSFADISDGASPFGPLIDVKGTLYGTTSGGGTNKAGTVFSITPTGTEKVLYSFKGGTSDGEDPLAGLINVAGKLYGTTCYGGASNRGTVFSISIAGKEHVLYSFGGAPDGAWPNAGLIDVKGMLYGTTWRGGTYGSTYGDGTVFSVSAGGKEQVLHSFGNGSDGYWPYASLIDVKGILYGTAYYGGAYGGGAVFTISTTGVEQVLHSFARRHGAGGPYASLIYAKGALYGTTRFGGSNGDGAVFRVEMAGVGHVLHSFGNSPDGANPYAGLVEAKGTLYGTTYFGGTHDEGTVFALTP